MKISTLFFTGGLIIYTISTILLVLKISLSDFGILIGTTFIIMAVLIEILFSTKETIKMMRNEK